MNIWVHFSVWMYISSSFGYILRSGLAGSYGNSMFNLSRNCETVFHGACSILHSHQQCARVQISPQSHEHLVFSGFLNFSHPNECEGDAKLLRSCEGPLALVPYLVTVWQGAPVMHLLPKKNCTSIWTGGKLSLLESSREAVICLLYQKLPEPRTPNSGM